MERFLRFVASPQGRWTRIGVGAVIATLALSRRVPFGIVVPASILALTGVFDVVPPARILGLPANGPKLRERLGMVKEAPLLISWSDRMSAKRAREGAPVPGL